ncbi:hypothetical protein ACNQQN_24850 [Mycobacteroides chelonae]|uniref:hypothetical protein n=1 Tax=Mycobacteroides chelonae TaxID=1774 RepID=UPI003AAD2317
MIDQQIDGKVVNVSITPKVDQKAADTAGKQVKDTIEKQTTDVAVKPQRSTSPPRKPPASRPKRRSKSTPAISRSPRKSNRRRWSVRVPRLASGRAAPSASRSPRPYPLGCLALQGRSATFCAALYRAGLGGGRRDGRSDRAAILDKVSRGNYTKAGESIKHSLVGAVDKANVGADIAVRLGNLLSGG